MEAIGMIEVTFGMISWGLIGSLRKEFEDLKKSLEESGALAREPETEAK